MTWLVIIGVGVLLGFVLRHPGGRRIARRVAWRAAYRSRRFW